MCIYTPVGTDFQEILPVNELCMSITGREKVLLMLCRVWEDNMGKRVHERAPREEIHHFRQHFSGRPNESE